MFLKYFIKKYVWSFCLGSLPLMVWHMPGICFKNEILPAAARLPIGSVVQRFWIARILNNQHCTWLATIGCPNGHQWIWVLPGGWWCGSWFATRSRNNSVKSRNSLALSCFLGTQSRSDLAVLLLAWRRRVTKSLGPWYQICVTYSRDASQRWKL